MHEKILGLRNKYTVSSDSCTCCVVASHVKKAKIALVWMGNSAEDFFYGTIDSSLYHHSVILSGAHLTGVSGRSKNAFEPFCSKKILSSRCTAFAWLLCRMAPPDAAIPIRSSTG